METSNQPGTSQSEQINVDVLDIFGDDLEPESSGPTTELTSTLSEMHAELNEFQREAALFVDGAALINAGAGAGKTKTVIHRVATMIHNGVPPTNILVTTFTNKAAGEIKDRLEKMVGDHAQYIIAGTFHSIVFRQMLQRYPESKTLTDLGLDMTECNILDEDEAGDIMKQAMKEALDPDELKMAKDESWTPKQILARMSWERAYARDVRDFGKNIEVGDIDEVFCRIVEKCWAEYNKGCRAVNGIDFADILLLANTMLENEPHIAEELARTHSHITIDEFQDTNVVQKNIMFKLGKLNGNIVPVGDWRQAIYGFNGAFEGIFKDFETEFPDAKVFSIDTNYRSKALITKIANACTDFMPKKIKKLSTSHMVSMQPNAEIGGKFNMVQFASDRDEASALANAIIRDIREGVNPNEIAVLYRQRSLRMKLEEELVSRKIPYRIVGDRSFFQRREVKDTVALLRYVFHPWDSLAAIRVLKNSKFSVSDKACRTKMKDEGINAHEFLIRASEETLKNSDKPKKHAYKVKPFLELCNSIREMIDLGDEPSEVRECLAKLWDNTLRSGVESASQGGKDGDSASLDARIGHVAHVFDRFQKDLESGLDVDEIIEDMTMMVEADTGMDRREQTKINLMTMHASKGLEWDNVYMMGLNNVALATDNVEPQEVEEGRRLFYVGITRARKNLGMTTAKRIFLNGQPVNTKPTHYMRELEKSLGMKIINQNAMQNSHSR